MNCPSCQAANSDDRRFCAECGAPLAVACAACGFSNQPGSRFCGGCGQPLAAAAPAAEPGPAVAPAPAAKPAEGERRQVTILFADLAGFTALSSSLDAEDLHALMERFFSRVDAAVEAYGGTVDKHIGDAVMALFGAPVAHGDDPLRAIRAAQDIHETVTGLGEDTGRPLAVHIGVASGEVLAGGLGGEGRRDYTVLGDSVNLASRLHEMAAAGETLISDAVYRASGGRADCEALGETEVKGLTAPVAVWRLRGVREEAQAGHRVPFIGRRAELGQVASMLDVCRESGCGQAIYLRGEAGLGKTRLLEEFAALAEKQGFASHKALVLDFGVGKGQDAIRALVRSLLGVAAGEDEAARVAAAERAETEGLIAADRRIYANDLLDLPQPEALRSTYDAMDNATRNRGKEATVVALVEAARARRPRFIAVENLHWADPVTLGHVAAIAAAVRDCPAVLAMTTRPEGDPFDGVGAGRARPPSLITIDLAPLRRQEAESLAKSLADPHAPMIKDCIERAGGNPLFLEQLLRNALETGSGEMPGTIQSLVLSRIDRLSPPDKAALQAASVIGQRFSLPVLCHLIGDSAYRPDGLIEHYLVRPEEDDLLFGHALIREGVYASLLKARRRELHLNAAQWFAEHDPVLRAEHLDRAEDPAAPGAYLAAARQMVAALRFERAEKLAARGLEIASEREERYSLTCLRGELLHDLGEVPDSIEAYRAGLELAEGDAERCRARIGMAAGMRVVDRYDEAFAALDEAEREATAQGLEPELARLCYLRGNLFFPQGDYANCREQHERALGFARRAEVPEVEVGALSGLADAEYMRGRMLTANRHFRDCVELARRHGFRRVEVANRSMIGFTRYYCGELPEAREDGQEASQGARAVGDLRAQLISDMLVHWVNFDQAELDLAKTQVLEALDLAERLGAGRFAAQIVTYLAKIQRLQGEREAARATAARAVELSLDSGRGFNGPRALAEAALNSEDPQARQAFLDRGEEILREGVVAHNQFSFYRDAMDCCLETGDWAAVERYAQALWDFTRQEPLPLCDFFVARARALVAHGQGERGETHRAQLQRLCEEAREMGLFLLLRALETAVAEA